MDASSEKSSFLTLMFVDANTVELINALNGHETWDGVLRTAGPVL